MKRFYLVLLVLLLLPSIVWAGTIAGTVYDSETNAPLPGANVLIVNSQRGDLTDVEGNFTIVGIDAGTYEVSVTYMGYKKMINSAEVKGDMTAELDFPMLETVVLLGGEVLVTANRARERETPVAFTNVGHKKIQESYTVQDIPHFFKNTPGVYVKSDGGSGMGDSAVLIRGFDAQRVQVMINGIPVNDPESKKVYWSNWGGLSGSTRDIQVQRGVGSSLYGSGAFGGSINIETNNAPPKAGGKVTISGGMYNTYKASVDIYSGLFADNKYALQLGAGFMNGNGWRQSTHYLGYDYRMTLSRYFEKSDIRLVAHAAPQEHGYSYYGFSPKCFEDLEKDEGKYGRNWNGNVFVREDDADLTDELQDGDGEVIGNEYVSFDNNVYHKPQVELHYNKYIDQNTYLKITAFASVGRGYGENVNAYYLIHRDGEGFFTIDSMNTAGTYQYRAHSYHQQGGLLANYTTKVGNAEHEVSFGMETRYWNGGHFGRIVHIFDKKDTNGNYNMTGETYKAIEYKMGGEKISFKEGDDYYDYTTDKPQVSFFGHTLAKLTDKISIMADLQYSFRHYHITEAIPGNNNRPIYSSNAADSLTASDSDYSVNNVDGDKIGYKLVDFAQDFAFFSPKVGMNYNINPQWNVFINYSQIYNEPRVKYFYFYGQPNENIPLETSNDFEFGVGYQYADVAKVKLNLYNITFRNKNSRIEKPDMANEPGYDYKGRKYLSVGDATYRGIELAVGYQIVKGLDYSFAFTGMQNKWGRNISDEGRDAGIAPGLYDVGTPMVTINNSINWDVANVYGHFGFGYYSDYWILQDNEGAKVEYLGEVNGTDEYRYSRQLPPWGVADAMVGYRFKVSRIDGAVSIHVNNVLDEQYWQSGDGYGLVPGPERNILGNVMIAF